MRAKQLKLIVTFFTTTAAIQMEKVCKTNNISGRLIPVPRSITSNCGMSWCSPPEIKSQIQNIVKTHNIEIEGWYEILV